MRHEWDTPAGKQQLAMRDVEQQRAGGALGILKRVGLPAVNERTRRRPESQLVRDGTVICVVAG
jgi:hypothetical protein